MDAATRSEVDFVRLVLLALFERATGEFDGFWSDDRTRRICMLIRPFEDNRHLEKVLPSEHRLRGSFRGEKCLLFLENVERGSGKTFPILDMSWDLNPEEGYPGPVIRFRLFLVHWDSRDSKTTALGFRFEPPEGPGAEGLGSHDYWHAQMIAEFEKGDGFLSRVIDNAPDWIPTKQPAFPLPAKRLGDLLAILLLSVYGGKQLSKIFLASDFHSSLTNRLKGMGIPFSATRERGIR